MPNALQSLPALLAEVVSLPKRLGVFSNVQGHEPKNAPATGLNCFVWADSIGPLPSQSSIASTCSLATFALRIQTNMLKPPMDKLDVNILHAAGLLMTKYNGHFRLGEAPNPTALVRNIDLMGAYGPGLSLKMGYLNQDGTMFRVGVVTLPLVLNDEFDQGA